MLSHRRVLIIVNPRAGRGRAPRAASDVANHLAQRAVHSEIRSSEGVRDAARWASAAAGEGFDAVVAVGGDGTLAGIASGMVSAAHRTPLAYVPAGTANLAARTLGVPEEPAAAADCIARGNAKSFDLGLMRDPERCFLLAAAIGFPAHLVRDAPRSLKHRIGRMAYGLAAVRNLRRLLRPARMEIDVDDRRLIYRSHTVLVSNLGADLGLPLDAQVDAHDGKLQVTLITARTLGSILAVLVRLLLRRSNDPRLVRLTTHSLRIRAQPRQPVHIDGELVGSTPISIEVLPNAIELLLP